MKHQIKNYLKLGIFLFGISFFFVNCEKDDNETYDNDIISNFKILLLNEKDLSNKPKLEQALKSIENKKKEVLVNKTVYSAIYDFSIETDHAKLVTSEGVESYTYKIFRETENNYLIENLVIMIYPDATTSLYLFQYNITEQESQLLKDGIAVDFSNKLNVQAIDDVNLLSNINSKMVPCDRSEWITIPASSCDSGQHSYGETTCDYIGEDGQATQSSSSWVIVPDWCEGGGGSVSGSGSGGGNNGSDVFSGLFNNTPPPPPNPCEKLNAITDNPTVRNQLKTLKEHSETSALQEKGFRTDNYTDNPNLPPNAEPLQSQVIQTGQNQGNGDYTVDIAPRPYTTMVVHTHPLHGSFHFFSPEDFMYFARMLETNLGNTGINYINPLEITYILTVNGETFALQMDDLQAVNAILDIYNDLEKREKFTKRLKRKYNNDNNPMTGTTTDINKQRNHAFNYLNDLNINLSIYKATYNNLNYLENWEKLNQNGTTTPCN